MAYTTAQLDSIIQTLESEPSMTLGVAEVTDLQGRKVVYHGVVEILKAITYFKALYDNASDATPNPAPKIRTFFAWGGKGI
jgi:hypothetical protein